MSRQSQLDSGLFVSDDSGQKQLDTGLYIGNITIGSGSFSGSPVAADFVLTSTTPVLVGAASTVSAQLDSGLYLSWAVSKQAQTDTGDFVGTPTPPTFSGAPAVATLSLTGNVPALVYGAFSGSPAASQIILTGAQPALSFSFSYSPDVGELVVTGVVLTLNQTGFSSFSGTPNVAQIALGGATPLISQTSTFDQAAGTTQIGFYGDIPALSINASFVGAPDPANLVISSQIPVWASFFGVAGTAQLIMTTGQPKLKQVKQIPLTQVLFGVKF